MFLFSLLPFASRTQKEEGIKKKHKITNSTHPNDPPSLCSGAHCLTCLYPCRFLTPPTGSSGTVWLLWPAAAAAADGAQSLRCYVAAGALKMTSPPKSGGRRTKRRSLHKCRATLDFFFPSTPLHSSNNLSSSPRARVLYSV